MLLGPVRPQPSTPTPLRPGPQLRPLPRPQPTLQVDLKPLARPAVAAASTLATATAAEVLARDPLRRRMVSSAPARNAEPSHRARPHVAMPSGARRRPVPWRPW